MTREETLRIINSIDRNILSDEECYVVDNIFELVGPSLPSNIGEAAEEFGDKAMKDYYNDIFVTENGVERPVLKYVLKHDFIDAFKAGAEWMAGQGTTVTGDTDKIL